MTTPTFWRRRRLTPADCLRMLPEPKLDVAALTSGNELRGAELRKAVLQVAQLNHVSETTLLRATVVNVRGAVPSLGE